jgi:hypothetical protein
MNLFLIAAIVLVYFSVLFILIDKAEHIEI